MEARLQNEASHKFATEAEKLRTELVGTLAKERGDMAASLAKEEERTKKMYDDAASSRQEEYLQKELSLVQAFTQATSSPSSDQVQAQGEAARLRADLDSVKRLKRSETRPTRKSWMN